MTREIKIFFDCGAPSLYNKLSRQTEGGGSSIMGAHIRNRKNDSFEYVKTESYLAYRQDFVDFIREHNDVIDTYPNLDVINNAELTYENQKWMEEQGLNPIPVWHLGSDVAWLCQYLDEGYDYIALGGMVPNSKYVLRPALDALWGKFLTDDAGMPLIKVHGFAMTSFDLMYVYPWYSVDSKSWIDIAKFGSILIPPILTDGSRNFRFPNKVAMTVRSLTSHLGNRHYRTASEGIRRGVRRYLKEIEVPLGTSAFKAVRSDYVLKENEAWAINPEVENKAHPSVTRLLKPNRTGLVEETLEMGVINTHYFRLDTNLQLYHKIEEAAPKWPWPIPRTIKYGKRGLF